MLVPRVGIVIVVSLPLLQNGPVDTSPLLLPPLGSATAAVLLYAAVIALFLLLRPLILLVNEKLMTIGERANLAASLCMAPVLPLGSPPPQRPPTEYTVSSPPLPINSSSSPKSPPYLASPSSLVPLSVSASASASYLCVYTPYVAVDVTLVPVLAVILIVRPPCNYCRRPHPFSSLVMGSVTCVYFVLEATERLVQQKKIWLENPRPL